DAILPRVFGEADAAGVFDLAATFKQKHAVVGIGDVDASAEAVARDAEVIALRLEAEQRQAEAALALEGAVAAAAVAAGPAEQAHDVALEIDFVDRRAVRGRDVGAALRRQQAAREYGGAESVEFAGW